MISRVILVVDDDAETRRALSRLLGGRFRVLSAANVAEAMQLLEREWIDLVLSDFALGVRSGLWLLQQVQVKYPVIRRVLLSASPPGDALGVAQLVFKKPWRSDLPQRLDALLSSY